MKYYSQNEEEKFIEEYFVGHIGTLLDVGANDGQTFSNSRRLIQLGWSAILIEPSPTAFSKLSNLYGQCSNVSLFNFALGQNNGKATLHESGAHVRNGNDVALVSSLRESETDKWRKSGVKFDRVEVEVVSAADFVGHGKFDFITIDAEGMDLEILKQIPLTHVRLLCIEWNGNSQIERDIMAYCARYGLTNVIHKNIENIILGR